MSESATATLCSCCRKVELIPIYYLGLDGEPTLVEVCVTCDGVTEWPNSHRKEEAEDE